MEIALVKAWPAWIWLTSVTAQQPSGLFAAAIVLDLADKCVHWATPTQLAALHYVVSRPRKDVLLASIARRMSVQIARAVVRIDHALFGQTAIHGKTRAGPGTRLSTSRSYDELFWSYDVSMTIFVLRAQGAQKSTWINRDLARPASENSIIGATTADGRPLLSVVTRNISVQKGSSMICMAAGGYRLRGTWSARRICLSCPWRGQRQPGQARCFVPFRETGRTLGYKTRGDKLAIGSDSQARRHASERFRLHCHARQTRQHVLTPGTDQSS
jgi:hypothetical protein